MTEDSENPDRGYGPFPEGAEPTEQIAAQSAGEPPAQPRVPAQRPASDPSPAPAPAPGTAPGTGTGTGTAPGTGTGTGTAPPGLRPFDTPPPGIWPASDAPHSRPPGGAADIYATPEPGAEPTSGTPHFQAPGSGADIYAGPPAGRRPPSRVSHDQAAAGLAEIHGGPAADDQPVSGASFAWPAEGVADADGRPAAGGEPVSGASSGWPAEGVADADGRPAAGGEPVSGASSGWPAGVAGAYGGPAAVDEPLTGGSIGRVPEGADIYIAPARGDQPVGDPYAASTMDVHSPDSPPPAASAWSGVPGAPWATSAEPAGGLPPNPYAGPAGDEPKTGSHYPYTPFQDQQPGWGPPTPSPIPTSGGPDPFGLPVSGRRIEPSAPPQPSRLAAGLIAGLIVGLLVFGAAGFFAGRATAPTAATPTATPSGAPTASLGAFERSQIAVNRPDFANTGLEQISQGWLPYLSSCARSGQPSGPALNQGEKVRVRCTLDGMSAIFVAYNSIAERDRGRQRMIDPSVDAAKLTPGIGPAVQRATPSGRTAGNYVEYAYRLTEDGRTRTVSGIWWDDAKTPIAGYLLAFWKEGLAESWEPMRDLWSRYA